jgi:glycosyltransferase involved in cell wall biosynthesis
MSRLRVLHVHNVSNWGGNLEHVRLVLAGLEGSGLDLFLAAPGREAYLRRFRDLQLTHLDFVARSRADVAAVIRLARLIRSHNIDLVHSHLRRTDWVCAWARLLCPGRIWLTTVHGEPNLGPDFRRAGGLRSHIYSQVLARAFDRVLAVSADLAAWLAAREGVPPRKLLTLVNGVDLERFAVPSDEDKARARQTLGLDPGWPVLVMAGRFGRRKGHDVLLRAAAIELAAGRPWSLLLVGDGALEHECRHLAEELGLAELTHFCGFAEDVRPFYRAADAVVMPSFSEGLPRALLEGMAMGLAPVGSDIGGIRELLADSDVGLSCAPGEPRALAGCLARLHPDPARRRELGGRARALIASHYRADQLVAQHLELYRELAT